MRATVFAAAMVVGLSAPAEGSERPLDATVETSAGKQVQLSTLWSKPTVLFYEDRDSTRLNEHVKKALYERGKERGLLDRVGVVAVANVAGFNWFPARNFVLAAIRDVEQRFKVQVYLDFTGALAASPWNLPASSSTVVLVDAAGRSRRQWKGAMSEAQVEGLLSDLEALVVADGERGH